MPSTASPGPTTRSNRHKAVWGRHLRRLAAGVLSALLIPAIASPALAQVGVTAEWDANTDPYTVGYRVAIGTAPGAYVAEVEAGPQTSLALSLPPGAVYYVIVRAYNAAGEFGPPSNEATIDLRTTPTPGAPTNFRASVSGSRATLMWNSPGGGVTQYLLYAGSAPGAVDIANGLPVGNVLTVSGDLPPGVYYARVRAANAFGAGPFSPEISFRVGAGSQPLAPANLSASWQGTVVTLSWAAPIGAPADLPTSYVVEAGSTRGASNIASFSVGSATSVSVDVPPGNYYVRVRGVNGGGVSNPSNEILLQGRGAPARPTSLLASGSGSVVNLQWVAPPGDTHTGFVIEAGSAPGLANLAVLPVGNTTSFSTTAPPGRYYVRVRAVNTRGASEPSNEIVVRR